MPRINLLFNDTYFAQLQENAAKENISLVRSVRDLIDIGLQVKAAIRQPELSTAKNNVLSTLGDDVKELWKNSLVCALESRYLIRFLVDNLTHLPNEKRDAVLNAVKEKAQVLVAELLEEK